MKAHTEPAHAGTPAVDGVLASIADYVTAGRIDSDEAYGTARFCLLDSLGCALAALRFRECTKLLGPVVPEVSALPGGARVPGTAYALDPVTAAFNIGTLIRWLDYNDTFLAAEWGHPSDNLGGILACADYHNRARSATAPHPRLRVRDILTAMIQAYEIQGVIALENAFNRVGLDHVILVRIATAAVATRLLGGDRQQIINALSNAWADGGALRVYRHAPNTGSRKSWAAGDATARGVWLALLALRGEMGYPSVLSAATWGFCEVLFRGEPLRLARELGSYVIEHILFKVAFPAEFHAQTAVEAAIALHPQVAPRLDQVARVRIETQKPALRIIHKVGPLANPADRDHCLQYMTAAALIHGTLEAEHYLDAAAADPRIDALRQKMEVAECGRYSQDYLDPEKRSVANAVQVTFADGTQTPRVEVEYPLGHRRRRAEARPRLEAKFLDNATPVLGKVRCQRLLELFNDPARLNALAADELMEQLVMADDRPGSRANDSSG